MKLMQIDVPDLSYTKALEFCEKLKNTTFQQDCTFDFSRVKNCDPFPMLIVSSTIRRLEERQKNARWKAQRYDNTYAQHMGFYSSCGANVGKKPGEAKGSVNYLPITKISVRHLQEESQSNMVYIGETIEKKSIEMSTVFSRGNRGFQNALTFLFREMIRNVPEHSGASEIWYSAQYWPSHDLVELAIMDEGCGILSSLSSNPLHVSHISNDFDALTWALQPGISRTFSPTNPPKETDDYWENSGFGLYMVSQICYRLGGSFIITSGDAALLIERDTGAINQMATHFEGTAVQMRIKPSRIIMFEEIKRDVLQAGEMTAKSNRSAFKKASKSSSGLIGN